MSAWSILPDLLIAVLATWLGTLVATRAPRDDATRPFGLFALLLAIWSAARIVSRLSGDAGVRTAIGGLEVGAASLLPAVTLHLVLAFAVGRRLRAEQRAALGLAYALGLIVGAHGVIDREHPIAPGPPHWEMPGLAGSGVVLGWGWIVVRAAVLALAIGWAWQAWWREGRGGARRDQLAAVLAAVVVGAVGGIGTIVLADLRLAEWPGMALIAVGLVLATYAVFARRALLGPEIARRAFTRSLGMGLLLAGFVSALLGLERLAQRFLALDLPLVAGLALVLTVALFDPVRERLRGLLDRRAERRDESYRRLLRALGNELAAPGRPEASLPHALAQVCRTFGVRAAAVTAADGGERAVYGDWSSGDATVLTLPRDAAAGGSVVFGPKRSQLAYDEAEIALLDQAAVYLVAALRLGERQADQAADLDALVRERDAVRSQEEALSRVLNEQSSASLATGLVVHALGPLRVELHGEPIRRWGGAKAGARQAEAMFAFLFDRGERGVGKDELLDVIWPDVPLDSADPAFHRTLGGLRRTLASAHPDGQAATITYYHDRYHLDPALIVWSDVAAFEEQVRAAHIAADPEAAIALLEGARALYRGDYLDDCPFYGDSEPVEERRAALRARHVDLLLALGERYEARGDGPSAAACFRDALRVSGDDCPRAEVGLARLGLAA